MIEFLLLVISLTLLYILLPIVSVYSFVKNIINRDWRNMRLRFFRAAYSIDQFGNVISSELFNDILIKKGGYKFGNPDETISSVMGKNYRDDTLTIPGKVLRWILDTIDENHCLKSIEEDETNTRK
jgi:hypothetical protein